MKSNFQGLVVGVLGKCGHHVLQLVAKVKNIVQGFAIVQHLQVLN